MPEVYVVMLGARAICALLPDLIDSGATLAEILAAGQWCGPAFLVYADLGALEQGAVLQAHLDEESSSDEEDD